MAGQPITRTYLARIEAADIAEIYNQVANGKKIAAIAATIGVSRAFLSMYLNSSPESKEALALAREAAAAAAPPSKRCGTGGVMFAYVMEKTLPQVKDWTIARLSLANSGKGSGGASADRASANHLAALKQLRDERAAPGIAQHQLTTEPQDPPPSPASP
jgi:hypothetical protein